MLVHLDSVWSNSKVNVKVKFTFLSFSILDEHSNNIKTIVSTRCRTTEK